MSDSFEILQDVSSTRGQFFGAPFQPVVQVVGDAAEIVFNQAYIFDYMGNATYPVKIADMDKSYSLSLDEPSYFYVEVTMYTGSGGVSGAKFKKEKDKLPASSPLLIQTTDEAEQPEIVDIEIAETEKFRVKELYFRDNIQWWGRLIQQANSPVDDVGHPIAEPNAASNQPLIIKSISGNGLDGYKIVDVFDEGNNNIVVSGITGYGVMYGDGPEGFETYKFLPYPTGTYINPEWHDVLEAATPFKNPAWSRKQYLPQSAQGVEQGDMLYWDANGLDGDGNPNGAWVILDAPTPAEMATFYGDPVLHHDGTVPYWGQDDYYL